jgi:DNA-binding CsgD family transcriptional regulator
VRRGLPGGVATEPGTLAHFHCALALQRVAAALSLAAGEQEHAKAWLAAHDRWLEWSGCMLWRSEGQALWAEYYRRGGDAAQARTHAERALIHATEPRQPLALLAAHRLLGELDTDARLFATAAQHLDTSLALADACAAPFERALTLLALAQLRATTGDSDMARQCVDAVRTICVPLGATPTLARADALAARLDAAHAALTSYPAGLSVREVEVLRLVAQGLSNPQVGERLFLSRRTVEQHLRSIFNKTGVPSRVAAARWADEHGLT